MIDEKRKTEAKNNFAEYLREGLIRKEHSRVAEEKYFENAELSLRTANELMNGPNKPHMWIVVISYYAMFYMANAGLLHIGYKTGNKIVHKVTSDALIVLTLDKLKTELLEDYELIKEDALEIASAKAENIIHDYELEKEKRSTFQYNMLE